MEKIESEATFVVSLSEIKKGVLLWSNLSSINTNGVSMQKK